MWWIKLTVFKKIYIIDKLYDVFVNLKKKIGLYQCHLKDSYTIHTQFLLLESLL